MPLVDRCGLLTAGEIRVRLSRAARAGGALRSEDAVEAHLCVAENADAELRFETTLGRQ